MRAIDRHQRCSCVQRQIAQRRRAGQHLQQGNRIGPFRAEDQQDNVFGGQGDAEEQRCQHETADRRGITYHADQARRFSAAPGEHRQGVTHQTVVDRRARQVDDAHGQVEHAHRMRPGSQAENQVDAALQGLRTHDVDANGETGAQQFVQHLAINQKRNAPTFAAHQHQRGNTVHDQRLSDHRPRTETQQRHGHAADPASDFAEQRARGQQLEIAAAAHLRHIHPRHQGEKDFHRGHGGHPAQRGGRRVEHHRQRNQRNRQQTDQHGKPEHAADVFVFHTLQAHQRIFQHRREQNADHFDHGDDQRADAQLRRRQQMRVDDKGNHRQKDQAELLGENPYEGHQATVGHGAIPEIQRLLPRLLKQA